MKSWTRHRLPRRNRLQVPQRTRRSRPHRQSSRSPAGPAKFGSRRLLNKRGSEKETWHIDFDLEECGLDYVVGDSFGIFAKNDLGLVDQIISLLGASHTKA